MRGSGVLRYTFALSAWVTFAASSPTYASEAELYDNFDDGEFLDGRPVSWTTHSPGVYDASSGDLVIYNTESPGAFATATTFSEGQVTVRALVAMQDLDPTEEETSIFVALNLSADGTGYTGGIWSDGHISIGRAPGGGFCCDPIAEKTLSELGIEWVPGADYWIELSFESDTLELRVWHRDAPRPVGAQLTAEDPSPFPSGVAGLGFRRVPVERASSGVFRAFEADVELDDEPPTPPALQDRFDDGVFAGGDPVAWSIATPAAVYEEADDKLTLWNTGNRGAFAVAPDFPIPPPASGEGRPVAVRSLVGFQDLDPNPVEADVFVALNFAEGPVGYLGELWWDGRIVIGRASVEGGCCTPVAEGNLVQFGYEWDPAKAYWLELRYDDRSPAGSAVDGRLELRVWPHGRARPSAPQLTYSDGAPHRDGVVGLGFRRLPSGGTSKGVFHYYEAGNTLAPCAPEVDLPEPPVLLPPFLRGDVNDDGTVNIADPIHTLNSLFGGGPATGCLAAANANGDEAVNISDPTYLLNHLFSGGPAPVPPYPECGTSQLSSDEELGCETAPEHCSD